jgi:hypothetical protein
LRVISRALAVHVDRTAAGRRPRTYTDPMARHGLRIPKALAVALVGSTATVAISFSGCNDSVVGVNETDEPTMADAATADGEELADAAVDARPDARPDAYVPPDTPVA